MSAKIYTFRDPDATDLPILTALSCDYVRDSFAACTTWRRRAEGANNLICDSWHRYANGLSDDGAFDPKAAGLMDQLLLALHVAIADIVESSGAAAPDCADSARLFALSADPVHRRAARQYALTRDLDYHALLQGGDLDGQRLLANASALSMPGLGLVFESLGDRNRRPAEA